MEVKYDITQYITSVKMSAKKRILVEGRHDKSHIKNLLNVTLGENLIKIDSAENIKGDCQVTAKNNRAKIEKVYIACKSSQEHSKLYYLCDREFLDFDIGYRVVDLMREHKKEGNLSWTLGHSLENYFIESDLISDAYRYLTNSEYKSEATEIFNKLLPSALKIITIISLAAKDIDKSSYPLGVISWDDFAVDNNTLVFDIDSWRATEYQNILIEFKKACRKYQPIVDASEPVIHARICRGHTAMQLLQRVFSCCLFTSGYQQDKDLAKKHATEFSKLKESVVSTALCEAWLRTIKNGSNNYPLNLVSSVA